MAKPEAILIAGPTASGKSRLALDLARSVGGVVVNADSMQVYDGLRILTARPRTDDMEGVEHRLYGHADPADPYSVGTWLREVEPLLDELRDRALVPVFCGGTGLYFKALLGGLDEMPAVPASLRQSLRARMSRDGPAMLHDELRRRDPESAERIRPGDPQRILRALELVEAAGRPLAELRSRRGRVPVDPGKAHKIVLTPPRSVLRERIAARFEAMLEAGALDEARAFASRPGALAHSAGQAIGVRELLAHAAGFSTLAEARDRAVARSRQYAKRQDTWFRHQFGEDWDRLPSPSVVLPPGMHALA